MSEAIKNENIHADPCICGRQKDAPNYKERATSVLEKDVAQCKAFVATWLQEDVFYTEHALALLSQFQTYCQLAIDHKQVELEKKLTP